MTITQLEYVIAVDNFRNFAEAAKHCYITQPTLSMQVKKLEEELGVLIFDRSKKPVIPSEVGKRILDQAREGLSILNRIPELIREEREELSGELRVGIIPTLSPYLLPLFAPRFVLKYPDVNINMEEMLSDQIIRELNQDQLDIGIMATPIGAPGIREIPVFYEAFFIYLSPDHPLASKSEIDPSKLDLHDMWVLNEGHCFRNQAINICAENLDDTKIKHRIRFQSGSIDTLRKLVDQQFGYTLLPELAVAELNTEQRSHVRPFAPPVPIREISMVTHRSFLKQRLIKAFQEELVASVPAKMLTMNSGKLVQLQKS